MEKANYSKFMSYLTTISDDSKDFSNVDLFEILDLFLEFLETVGNDSATKDITFHSERDYSDKGISLADNPHLLLLNITEHPLSQGSDLDFLQYYIDFESRLLRSTKIPELSKLIAVTVEEIADCLSKLVFFDYEKGLHYYMIRIEFFKRLYLKNEINLDSFREDNPNLGEIIFNNYCRFRGRLIRHYLNHEKMKECKEFVLASLNETNKKLFTSNMYVLIQLNDLYTLMPKEEIFELYSESKKYIIDKSRSDIENRLSIFPVIYPFLIYQNYIGNESLTCKFPHDDNGKPLASRVSLSPLVQKTKVDKFRIDDSIISHTVVEFVISYEINATQLISDSEHITFYFKKIEKYTDHPLYNLVNRIGVAGLTIQHFLDMEQNSGFYTHVRAVMKEPFHPEFKFSQDIDETKVNQVFFQEEEELFGTRYSPTKIRILKGLKDAFENHELSTNFDNIKVNSDLFSSFSIRLIVEGKIAIDTSIFFTSVKIFEKYTSLYYDKLSEFKVYSKDVIYTFMNLSIDSGKSFNNCISYLIDNLLVSIIRGKSGYKYLWKDDLSNAEPRAETEVQPYLLHVLESICQTKGINVSREINSAEGSIDMLFSYTTPKGKLLKVCVEVKNAHHNNIEAGIATQLVTYLKSQNSSNGIYLVLWYKNKDGLGFQKPKKYNSPDDLKRVISTFIPDGYDIRPILIDCTKPMSPSKIRFKNL